PAPLGDIEEEGAGRVRRVDGPLAGEAIADVVLREHDSVDALVDLGLMAAQPQELGRREARERPVPGQLDQAFEPDQSLDLRALCGRALVVPEDRRAK